MSDYYQKYLKYKNKYIDLKNQLGGSEPELNYDLEDFLFTRKFNFNELLNIFTDESRDEFKNDLEKFLNSLEHPSYINKSDNISIKFKNLYNAKNYDQYIESCKNVEDEDKNKNYELRDDVNYLLYNNEYPIYYKKNNDNTMDITKHSFLFESNNPDENALNNDYYLKINSLSNISYITSDEIDDFYKYLNENTERNPLWRYRKKIKENGNFNNYTNSKCYNRRSNLYCIQSR